jgi:CheY-like chemotaxis protein
VIAICADHARAVDAARFNQVTTQTETLRVLCVDDDVLVLGLVTEVLQAEGYDVQTAVDGAHALQKIALAERPYNLIIADGRMPHLDGWGFIMQARANGYAGRIIVFSAYLDADERRRYRKLDVDAIIQKPPGAGELLMAVKEAAGM